MAQKESAIDNKLITVRFMVELFHFLQTGCGQYCICQIAWFALALRASLSLPKFHLNVTKK